MVVQGPETDNLVDDITSACTDANPYYAVAVKPRLAKGDPSIALIRDTTVGMLFEDTSMWHILAAEQDTGTIHGLAYDATRSHLYAAGIFSNDYLVRPSDLGLIYRIDLTTRKLTTVATLPAGSDLRPKVQPLTGVIAPEIIHAIGRLGLGDIDVDEDGRYLFAMNLFDKRIYRLALPDMKGLIALPTGDGMAKADEEVLPFGIGVRNGYLYHGVVILPAEGPAEYVPRVALYRSTLEGDDLQLLAMDELRYRRQGPWQAWRDSRYPDSSHAYRNVVEPQLLDIEFTATGLPIIGIGNRRMWIFQSSYYGGGNALPTELDHEGRLSIRLDPDYFADAHDVPLYPDSPLQHDVLNGTLAPGPVRGQLVATTWDSEASGGLRWLSTEAPTLAGPINGVEAVFGDRGAVGDIERLCPPDRLSPSATPTPTDLFLATDTPIPTDTPTQTPPPPPSPTTTRTPRPTPIYLPLAQRSHCLPVPRLLEVSLVVDLSTSMLRPSEGGGRKVDGVVEAVEAFVDEMLGDRPGSGAGGAPPDATAARVGLVGFHHEAVELAPLSADGAALRAAAAGLPGRLAEGTRLDLALRAGARQVTEQGRPGAQRVLILITDGLPNQVPTPAPAGSQEDAVLREALSARDAGVLLVTVGLGRPEAADPLDRINAQLLAAIAGDPARYHQTPDARRLAAIYRQIAGSLRGCP